MKTLVIGAQNIDIFAQGNEQLSLYDSNIGTISIDFGGVGGNIVSNLHNLHNDVSFLTIFGDDHLSRLALTYYAEKQIDISKSISVSGLKNSVYLGVLDEQKDLYVGINSMELLSKFTPELLKQRSDYINQFDVLVLDNNLPKETLEYIVKTYQNRYIVVDAVSAKKAPKLQGILQSIDTLKVNVYELAALSSETEMTAQINELLESGVGEIIVTNGKNPVYYASSEIKVMMEPFEIDEIINATGAGDAFVAGYVHGIINKKDVNDRLAYALKMAYLTLQSPTSVNQHIVFEEE
jgi:pseudouridine kinase